MAEYDFDGKDMQYGLDDLPIEKPDKTPALKTSAYKAPALKASTSKTLASSSQDILENA